MAKNVCLQVAALSPKYTSRAEVDQDYLAKEEEILTAAAKNEKPDANDKIIMGMVKGRLNKELKEICLLDQVYVKAEDGKQTVGKYVDEVAKANCAKITIKGFVRMETGEGIEKKQDDFAAEVAAQMGMQREFALLNYFDNREVQNPYNIVYLSGYKGFGPFSRSE